jgi:hypothetical protein
MEIEKLISHIRKIDRDIKELEKKVDDLFSENSELIVYVVENWKRALSLSFFRGVIKMMLKKTAFRKLAAKCLRSILSVNSAFVMNVSTVKTWRRQREYSIITFSEDEVRHLYDAIIALEHDSSFLDQLWRESPFHYNYFLTKVPYIKRHKAYYEGIYNGKEGGPLEFPLLTDLIEKDRRN